MPALRIVIDGARCAAREAAAEAALARHDFGDVVVTERLSHWTHESVAEAEGERVYRTLLGEAPESGETVRAQFNVFFVPGTETVATVYEGDWMPVD